MTGGNGSRSSRPSLLLIFMLIPVFAATAHDAVHGDDRSSLPRQSPRAPDSAHEISGEPGTNFKYGKMTFDEALHHGSDSDEPTTCTCTCYRDVPESPKTPLQSSPMHRDRSPPPAPYRYSPSPAYSTPAPPTGSTTSPVTFNSPPPAPYYDIPAYNKPSPPVVAAPETFVPPPPPSPVYWGAGGGELLSLTCSLFLLWLWYFIMGSMVVD